MNTRRTRPALLALTLGIALAGCSDDGADVRDASSSSSTSGSASGSGSGSGSGSSSTASDCPSAAADPTAVAVKMEEFDVEVEPATARAGRLTFVVTNSGEDVHELVVVKADDAAKLPRVTSTDPATNGQVDENKLPAGAFVGEVEGIPAGRTCAGSFPLTAGKYVLFCNIVEIHDGKPENHFELGMQAPFAVA